SRFATIDRTEASSGSAASGVAATGRFAAGPELAPARVMPTTPLASPSVWTRNHPLRRAAVQYNRFCCKLCCWRTSRMIEGERSGRRQYGSGELLQGAAVYSCGDPLGRAMVSDVPCQLPRSGAHAPRPRSRVRPHDDLPMDPGLRNG